MSTSSSSRGLVWIGVAALGLLIAFVTILYVRGDRNPVAQIALKEERLALVTAMRLSLAATSEALNSAVMSTREQDSKAFAEEARRATADLERGRASLHQILKKHGDQHEAELMARVGQSLVEFQQVQQQLLDLAVQNSNRKAFELAFGPAMKIVNEMNEGLARIATEYTDSASEARLRVVQLADEARIGILSTQVLLMPHIAEASDMKMDELEVQLSEQARKVRESLDALRPLLPEKDRSKIETTMSRYAEFEKLKHQIIKLSRQNTDLQAVTIALKEKRQTMLACQDAFVALENAIRAEPITSTIPSGRSHP